MKFHNPVLIPLLKAFRALPIFRSVHTFMKICLSVIIYLVSSAEWLDALAEYASCSGFKSQLRLNSVKNMESCKVKG